MKPTVALRSSVRRLLPHETLRGNNTMKARVLRGEVFSFQVVFRMDEFKQVSIKLKGKAAAWSQVRRIGLVPVHRHTLMIPSDCIEQKAPCFAADPLFPDAGEPIVSDGGVCGGYWITVRVPRDARKGTAILEPSIAIDGKPAWRGKVTLEVLPVEQPELPAIPVTNWFYCDAIMDWYGLEPWSPEHFRMLEPYMRSAREHGQNVILTPTITPPLDGVKTPHQLVGIRETSPDNYRFDMTNLRKYLRLVKRLGFEWVELAHLFTQWGARYAPAIYGAKGRGKKAVRLFDAEEPATGKRYRRFLEQFLPAAIDEVAKAGYRDRTIPNLSDEPHADHIDNYRAIGRMVREIDPSIRFTDCLSSVEMYRQDLVDNPVPSIRVAKEFYREKRTPTWVYFCCNPKGRFINRFLDIPLNSFRMLGWTMWKHKAAGFLHWGFNYWYVSQTNRLLDPYMETDGRARRGWSAGDTFLVYPGAEGPVESIRHETFRETMQDHALLRRMDEDGIDLRDIANPLRGYDRFPREDTWTENARQSLLKRLSKRKR